MLDIYGDAADRETHFDVSRHPQLAPQVAPEKKILPGAVMIPRNEFNAEHKRLIKVLGSKNPEELEAEKKKQKEEIRKLARSNAMERKKQERRRKHQEAAKAALKHIGGYVVSGLAGAAGTALTGSPLGGTIAGGAAKAAYDKYVN